MVIGTYKGCELNKDSNGDYSFNIYPYIGFFAYETEAAAKKAIDKKDGINSLAWALVKPEYEVVDIPPMKWTLVREAATKNLDRTITRNIIQTIEKTFATKGAANRHITKMGWEEEITSMQNIYWKAVQV